MTSGIPEAMINDVERHPSTWTAAVKLALIVSAIAVLVAVAASVAGDVPQAAVVMPVILVAFTASWIQTARADQAAHAERVEPSLVDTRRHSTV